MAIFESSFFQGFWDECDYARVAYTDVPLSSELRESVEQELGYMLPKSYIELALNRNGGMPSKTCHPTPQPNHWSASYIEISGILAIGRTSINSLCGQFSSRFWMDEWGYPDIGVYIASTPSAGHEMIGLDYRLCGPSGEPTVVCVDQEFDYEIAQLAPNFESFIRSLVEESHFEN